MERCMNDMNCLVLTRNKRVSDVTFCRILRKLICLFVLPVAIDKLPYWTIYILLHCYDNVEDVFHARCTNFVSIYSSLNHTFPWAINFSSYDHDY